MNLTDLWEYYSQETTFNFSSIEPLLSDNITEVSFKQDNAIIYRGDFPDYIYFIKQGKVAGIRDYEDGNDYNYFELDHTNGCIGLLEILGKREEYIATVTCLTDVVAIKVSAATVYHLIMTHDSLLRRCTSLLASDLYKRSGNDGLLYRYKGIDRVRYYLIQRYDEYYVKKGEMELIITESYDEIAKKIGVSVRTIGRSIQHLKKTEEISNNKRILSVNYDQFKKLNVELRRI